VVMRLGSRLDLWHSGYMRRYFEWILGRQRTVLLVVALISALSLVGLSRAVVSSSVGDLFFGDAPEYLAYLELIREFGSDEVIAVAYEETDPFGPRSLDKLEAIRTALEANPEVERTTSLLDLERIRDIDGTLHVDQYAELARADPEGRSALKAEIMADPLLAAQVFSRTGDHSLILVELKVDPERSGEIAPQLNADCLAIFAAQGYGPEHIHEAGFPAVMAEMIYQTYFSFKVIFPVTVFVMIGAVTMLFRTPLPVFLSVAVSLLSALWTVGISAFVSPKLSLLYGMVPSVVTIVAVSDVIHLWSAYLHELALGQDRDEAILSSATDVGRACLLTSVTTSVGFLSIALIPTPMFQELGVVLGAGVGIALLLAMTLVPIAASRGKRPSESAQRMENPIGRLVNVLVRHCAALSTQYPRRIIGGFLVASAVLTWGFLSTDIEASFINRLSKDNHIRQDASWFEEEFSGGQTMDVFVSAETPERILDPDVMHGIAALQTRLEATDEVDDTLSIADVIKRIDAGLGGTGTIPASREAISQYLLLFELGGGANLDPFLDFDRTKARIVLRMNEHRMRRVHDVAQTANALGVELLPSDVKAEGTGMMPLVGGWLDQIVRGQRNGVLVSILSITVLMIIGVRSVRVGMWSMVPNMLPLVAVTATAHWIWDEIDSDTLVVLMMAIGIGVDDTIHFLTRFRIESARSQTIEEAINKTFAFAGRAIVMTTIILAAGFSPFVASDYWSTWILGTLLPLALIVAMVADLLLVPALAKVGIIRFPLATDLSEEKPGSEAGL
jgi:predicted RND superfamily exporter protein